MNAQKKKMIFSIIIVVLVFFFYGIVHLFMNYNTKEHIMKMVQEDRSDIVISKFYYLEIQETKGFILLGKIEGTDKCTFGYGHSFLLPNRYAFYETTDVLFSYLNNHKSKSLLGDGAKTIIKDDGIYLETKKKELIKFQELEVVKK